MTAPTPADVPILQTASSLVELTSDTYTRLQRLPYAGGGTALAPVRALLATAVQELDRARTDLARATRTAGGRVQTSPNAKYAAVVEQALPTVRGPGDVVGLLLTLEDVLAQTLVADVVDLSSPDVRVTVLGHATAAGPTQGPAADPAVRCSPPGAPTWSPRPRTWSRCRPGRAPSASPTSCSPRRRRRRPTEGALR